MGSTQIQMYMSFVWDKHKNIQDVKKNNKLMHDFFIYGVDELIETKDQKSVYSKNVFSDKYSKISCLVCNVNKYLW